MNEEKTYSVAIRTLGTGGEKYRATLDSIAAQTRKPQHVYVVIADGYALPPERLGTEEFVRIRKGMFHQRVHGLLWAAEHCQSDYVLALDDDVAFAPDYAERCLALASDLDADMLATDSVTGTWIAEQPQAAPSALSRLTQRMLGNRPSDPSCPFASHLTASAGGASAPREAGDTIRTQYASGTAMWVRNGLAAQMDYASEYWVEATRYAYPDDVVFGYKLWLNGYNLWHTHTLCHRHLDAGCATDAATREADVYYASGRNVLILWHRFLLSPAVGTVAKARTFTAFWARTAVQITYELLRALNRRSFRRCGALLRGLADGLRYTRSEVYRRLPSPQVGNINGYVDFSVDHTYKGKRVVVKLASRK